MSDPKPYKTTLFDRHGPAAADYLRAYGYGLMVCGLVISIGGTELGFSVVLIAVGVASGFLVSVVALALSGAVGWTWKRFMVDGTSTPYVEQYSYQQALVMQGRVDEALESFEAVAAEQPDAIDPRIKAAELYLRERQNHARAAELFRQVQRIETVDAGRFLYVTNRLVDLYTGPLADPGRALVELRKLIERYPGTAAASQAREALATLKARHIEA